MERLHQLTRRIAALPPGAAFARYAQVLAASNGSPQQAAELAKKHYSETTPAVELVLRAAVAAGGTSDADWARPLIDYGAMADVFVELLRPETVLGRLVGTRRVPFLTRTIATGQALSAGWVGEGRPIPVGKHAFESVQLEATKVAGLVVITNELARAISSASEASIQSEMIASVAACLDRSLIDPAAAAVPGVSPASLTANVPPIPSTGSTAAAITADLSAAAASLIAAGSNLRRAVWVLHPRTALYLTLLRDAGGRVFPDVSVLGGTLLGLPVLCSVGAPLDASPSETTITLIDASRVLVADDGETTLDASGHAAIQMVDTPTNGAAAMVSLYQIGAVGLRVIRHVNWQAVDAAAVAWISHVAY